MFKIDDRKPHERLKLERMHQQSSAKDFAVSLQIPQTTYGSLERDAGRLEASSAKMVLKICKALDLRPEWLLNGEEPKRPSDNLVGVDAGALERAIQFVKEFEVIDGKQFDAHAFAKKTVLAYREYFITRPTNI